MIANTILGDRILTGSMDANRIQAARFWRQVASLILVSSAEPTIAQTAARAEDPAASINTVGRRLIGQVIC